MKKKYIKPATLQHPTFYANDVMDVDPILKHSYDWVGGKERDAEEDYDEIGERPNDYGIEPMTLW